jgi:YesN/AraC family two-component response regulator
MGEQIELITMLKELHNISGFRISVYDTEFKEISAYPKELNSFCKYIQECKKGKESCKEYDTKAFEKVKQTKETYIYRCKFGLYEAVSPLYHFGILSGYLMMGQTLDNDEKSKAFVYQSSSEYAKDKERLLDCINHIPLSSKDKISSCISIMKICADYITLSNRWKESEKEFSSRIKKYINQHYQEKITLDSLSDVFYCSRSTLTTNFKNSFHISIIEYLTKVRIEHAIKLLDNESMSIKNIAIACGYSDQNYFTKVFQKATGLTPRDYRLSLS